MDHRHQGREGCSPRAQAPVTARQLDIRTTCQHMSRKDMEHLVGKLRSMNLALLGAVAHLYHIQRAIFEAGADRALLYPELHREIAGWRKLVEQTSARPTHLV